MSNGNQSSSSLSQQNSRCCRLWLIHSSQTWKSFRSEPLCSRASIDPILFFQSTSVHMRSLHKVNKTLTWKVKKKKERESFKRVFESLQYYKLFFSQCVPPLPGMHLPLSQQSVPWNHSFCLQTSLLVNLLTKAHIKGYLLFCEAFPVSFLIVYIMYLIPNMYCLIS